MNKLSLNANKSEFMIIGNAKQLKQLGDNFKCEINGEQLTRVHNTKYPGIQIDECLNWDAQYKIIKKKLKAGLASLSKLKDILPQSKLVQVYKALFESHLRHANVIWGNLSNTNLTHLQTLQDRAFRHIQSARCSDGWICDWLDVHSMIRYDKLVMTYKILNRECPEKIKNVFKFRSEISNYQTRNSDALQVIRLRLELTKKSFCYSAAKSWNNLSKNNRGINPMPKFKKYLKAHLRI